MEGYLSPSKVITRFLVLSASLSSPESRFGEYLIRFADLEASILLEVTRGPASKNIHGNFLGAFTFKL